MQAWYYSWLRKFFIRRKKLEVNRSSCRVDRIWDLSPTISVLSSRYIVTRVARNATAVTTSSNLSSDEMAPSCMTTGSLILPNF